MSIFSRLRRWWRLDTDGEGRDLSRYDESERQIEARLRAVEAHVGALQTVRQQYDNDLRHAEGREGRP